MVVQWRESGGVMSPTAAIAEHPRHGAKEDDFERLDELWNATWSGDVCPPSAPPTLKRRSVGFSEWSSDPSLAVRSRGDIGYRHPLCAPECGDESKFVKSSSWSVGSGTPKAGLLKRVKSWMGRLHDRPKVAAGDDQEPCQASGEWRIPPYPQNYDWDER